MCVWGRHMCVWERPMCALGTHMCALGTPMCAWERPSRCYILIFPSLFFFQPFFSGTCLCFIKIPFFPPIEFFISLGPHQKKSWMESQPVFSLGLAYVFS